MVSDKQLKIAYGLAIVLLIVGFLSYSASSAKAPETPVRMMFQCSTGKVLFDHKTHTGESGYGIACGTCHHHPEDAETFRACKACHVLPADGSIPTVCLDCHDEGEIEVDSIMKKTDALHGQCIGCHKEQGAGPEECSACHLNYSL